MFIFSCPSSWRPEQLALLGMKKLQLQLQYYNYNVVVVDDDDDDDNDNEEY